MSPQQCSAVVLSISICLLIGTAAAVEKDMCEKYGDMMPIPGIAGTDLCSTAHLTSNNMEKCMLLDLAGNRFTRSLGNSIGALACRAAHQVPIATATLDGRPINHSLTEARPLPANFEASLMNLEGSTYHFWWTQLYNFGIISSCAATQTPHTVTKGPLDLTATGHKWNHAPGWEIHSVTWSNANTGTTAAGTFLPLATVMVKGDTVAVVIRGTETFNDWEADFTYSQASFSGPISWPGRTHEGFSRLAAYLWSTGLQEAVQELVLAPGSGVEHVVVTGHSMGAGVSTLLSYTIQDYLAKQKSRVRVDAILFAPPNVGDKTFAEAYGSLVNGRRIPFQADIVPQLPCAPTVTACVRGPWDGAPLISAGVWAYQVIPGTVAITAEGMPMENEAWASFKDMYPCQLGRYVLATHVCAYQCYLSQFVSGGVSSNMCRLWRQESGAGVAGGQGALGSYCMSFPVAAGPDYPYQSAAGIMGIVQSLMS